MTQYQCGLWGCQQRFHDIEDRVFPLPNDVVYHQTVIASVYYDDDTATLLLLRKEKPFFEVAQLDLKPHGNLRILSEHDNIVPAVREYEQEGGDY